MTAPTEVAPAASGAPAAPSGPPVQGSAQVAATVGGDGAAHAGAVDSVKGKQDLQRDVRTGASPAVWALAVTLAKRDLRSRYVRSQLGAVLTVLQPVLWLATAVLAFWGLMGAGVDRSGGAGAGWLGYAARTAAALAVWLPLAECWGRAPNGFAAQGPLVRRTRFPLRAIPVSLALAALATGGICLVLALAAALCGGARLTADSFPLIVCGAGLMVVWLMAGSFLLSAVGIFFRDLNSLIGHFLTLGMLVTPVYYDPAVVPERLAWAVRLNPLATPAVLLRTAFGSGDASLPIAGWSVFAWVAYSGGLGLAALAVGTWVFRRLAGRIAEQV